MFKKLFTLFLTTIICIFPLASCQMYGDGVIVDNSKDIRTIVYADGSLNLNDIHSALGKVVGGSVRIVDDTIESSGAELVIGNTSRPISVAARKALEKELSKTENYDEGYIIYSDGESLALYWTMEEMIELAFPKLISEYLSGTKIELESGILFTDLYRKDVFERDKAWALIEANSTPEVLSALKELYAFFDGSMLAGWCANLYDPESGGFYYSISGRDNEPFRADLESTSQLLGVMESNGAYKDQNAAIPEEIKAKIISFVKDMQSTTDGYFYHPQWPQGKENLSTDRYGRDQTWAISIINDITLDTDGDGVQEKQYPNYCNPAKSAKCKAHAGTKESCVFPIADAQYITSSAASDNGNITDVICVSVSSAVSKVKTAYDNVIATATVSDRPDYSSREAFRAWLYAYNDPEQIKENSGKAHNLAALRDEIASHGMIDILIDQLNTVQAEVFEEQLANGEEPTGLWQRNVDYKAVWGLLKYMSVYSVGNAPIDVKYLPYIAKTCVKVIQLPAGEDYHMNDLYNQWAGITNLISNVKKYNAGSENLIYDVIRENSAPLISNSLDKIKNFKIEDGSFGYTPGGYSAAKMYGQPTSLGVHEGDVNSAALVTTMYRAVFECLGYKAVPLFTEADGKAFVDTLVNCEPIVKNELYIGTMDFESGYGNVTFNPGHATTAYSDIVSDPTDPSNNVISFYSPVLTSGNGASLECKPTSAGRGCFIFETKMYVEESASDYFLQITLGSKLYMLTINKKGDTVTINERNTGSGANQQSKYLASAPMNEWFTLRVEYYVPEETGGIPNIKIWVNDEFVRNSQFYYDNQTNIPPKNNITEVKIYAMRSAGCVVYFDDMYCSVESKDFDPAETQISDIRKNQ